VESEGKWGSNKRGVEIWIRVLSMEEEMKDEVGGWI
jgi:hypothetical protein